jgi:uncharacterized heparinase superfamily protein
MNTLVRFGRTVSHLRPSQVTWRLRYLVQRKVEALPWMPLKGLHFQLSRHVDATVRDLQALPRLPEWEPFDSAAAAARLAEVQAGRLTLLHHTRPFAGGDDWCLTGGRTEHRLGTYNLHYHRWLTELAWAAAQTGDAAYDAAWQRGLRDWLDVCRQQAPGFTHYPWNSFTIATRLQWWQRLWTLRPPATWGDAELVERTLDSFVEQARYLSRHIEWDLRGNHLLRDAAGLVVAARGVRHRESRRWMKLAKRIADGQSTEQILPDGGHFERSPMYHLHALEDLVLLTLLVDNYKLAGRLRDVCARMAEFVVWMRHPDGSLPLFNDASQHTVCDPTRMLALLNEFLAIPVPPQPQGLKHFSDTGLVAWHGSPWTVFWDVGEIGPDYQPGHAHADTLSLECSVRGRKLIVDPGTYCYDRDDRRRYDRSTAAHNTVCIDDADSSEVWHIFRVGARARPLGVDIIPRRNGFSGWAEHNGYDTLPGGPRHARQLVVDEDGPLKIIDRVTGSRTHRIAGGHLLAPEWAAEPMPGGWRLSNGEMVVDVRIESPQPLWLDIERRPWHPEYGVEIETNRLTWRCEAAAPCEVTTMFSL